MASAQSDQHVLEDDGVGCRYASPQVACPLVGRLFNFRHEMRAGLHVYVSTAGDDTLAGPLWSGLQPPYALEPRANPWFRFGINNADGEDLAVWRALAWALTEGSERYALPTYDRDQVAAKMHVPRHEVVLVRWEYRIDVRQNTFGEADIGFVPAKACVRTHPSPDQWELEHRHEAGIFHLSSFADLTVIDVVLSTDVTSEISIFALHAGMRRAEQLIDVLRGTDRPQLAEALRRGDIFVDLAVVRDRFLGYTSYFTVASPDDIGDRLGGLRGPLRVSIRGLRRSCPDAQRFRCVRGGNRGTRECTPCSRRSWQSRCRINSVMHSQGLAARPGRIESDGSLCARPARRPLSVEPLRRIPKDRRRSDRLEANLRVIALDEAQHAVTDQRSGPCLDGEDIQDRLSHIGLPRGESVVVLKHEYRSRRILSCPVGVRDHVAQAVVESSEVPPVVARKVQGRGHIPVKIAFV